MRRLATLYIVCLVFALPLRAQEVLLIHRADGQTVGAALSTVDSISFADGGRTALFHIADTIPAIAVADIDSLTLGDGAAIVRVYYDGQTAHVTNPMAYAGITAVVEGADVVITSTTDDEVEYVLSGATSDGMFKLYSDKKYTLTFDGVEITNGDGPAVNLQSGKKATIQLVDGTTSHLGDGKKYTAYGDEDMKGTFFSEGQLVFTGSGTLDVTGLKKHGICSDDYIQIKEGHLLLHDIASDGLHANDYIRIDGGIIEIAASGDGIDGDAGYVVINGGTVDITVSEDTNKGIKCDSTITLSGGIVTITTTGGTLVEEGDPSYCTAIKAGHDIAIHDGTFTITSTGKGGKGLSADGDILIDGGIIEITTSGDGATYADASGATDSYSAACIKADGDILISGGIVTLTSSGTAGKGINADGKIHIGAGGQPQLTVNTSGKKFLVSGSGQNADYANPKCIKADGNLLIDGGLLSIHATQDGGEGIESKDTLTIAGGDIEIETYDDGINAAHHLHLAGGRLYCYATGNDAADSNGTLTVSGGIHVLSGARTPECGIDCDNNKFAITGGVLVATGGSNSTPTTSLCTQCCVSYNATSLAGQTLCVRSSDGLDALIFTMPNLSTAAGGNVVLFTSPLLQKSVAYTILVGGTATGGDVWHGYHDGATYDGGETANTFTTTSTYTNLSGNQAGGGTGPGGGGRPW